MTPSARTRRETQIGDDESETSEPGLTYPCARRADVDDYEAFLDEDAYLT